MPVGPIERLSEDELLRVHVVAEIEPVGDAAPRGRERVMYLGSGTAVVDATDDEIKIVVQVVIGAQMPRDSLPVEPQNRFGRLMRTTDLNRPISLAENGWRTQLAAEIRSPSITATDSPEGCPPAISAW